MLNAKQPLRITNNINVVFRPERFYILIYKLANCKIWKSGNKINKLVMIFLILSLILIMILA